MLISQAVYKVMQATYGDGNKKAVQFISPELTVTAARMHKPRANSRGQTVVVTIGKPNYAMRALLKRSARLPKQLVLTPFPLKKKK